MRNAHVSPELADADPILWETVRSDRRLDRIDDEDDNTDDEREAA